MTKEIQIRGKLTQKVKDMSKELFGFEFGITELRLLPYLQYTMMNEQKLDINKINSDERIVLAKLRKIGYIEGGASGLNITKDFWDKTLLIILQ